MALLVVYAVIGAVAVLMTWKIINLAHQALIYRSEGFSREKFNSNVEAADLATSLVREAEKEIEIYDDGDYFEGSTYDYDPFIEAVEDKLRENPSFKIRCFFNEPDQRLAFIRKFKGHDQVAILARTHKNNLRDPHYKAIDGWLKGVVSLHELGDGERSYRDFSYEKLPAADIPRGQKAASAQFRQSPRLFKPL